MSLHVGNLNIALCERCLNVSVWIHDGLVWPHRGEAPEPNEDLPPEVRADYEEAGSILNLSPRGAAALLRLSIQKLCKHLGGSGKNINADIGDFVSKGLDQQVQQALDVVRVIGNNAVHPGQIDLNDDRKMAASMFALVNLIAHKMITEPKNTKSMFDDLPKTALEGIEKRDSKT